MKPDTASVLAHGYVVSHSCYIEDLMNTQLVDSLVQAIRALSVEERAALEEKLFFETDAPTASELVTLALRGGSFDFLADEPDLYSLADGEPINAAS